MNKLELVLFFKIVIHLFTINVKSESEALSQSGCESGWHQYGIKCFKYHHDQAGANFHDAFSICEYAYQATLVTIHSEDESNYLVRLAFEESHAKYSIWIGLIRVSNSSFVWFDRSDFNYTNWGPNEPNNWQSKNYCVVLSSASTAKGRWFDVGCTTTYLIMCQKYIQQISNNFKDNENSSDLIADEINMDSDAMFNADKRNGLDLHVNELNHVKVLANVNIVLTSILFVVLFVIILSNYSFFIFCRKRQVNQFNSLEDGSNSISL